MLTCGRDTDRRSGRQVGANADRLRGMIIVDSLPKAVTSTNSNCAREVRVHSVLPMMIAYIPSFIHAGLCRLSSCDLHRLRLAVIGEGDIHSSVGLSSAVDKFSSGRTIRQSVKRPMSHQTGTLAINVIAELRELTILFRLARIRPGLPEAFASPSARGESSAAHPGS
jgi:hypothetical protein